MTDKETGKKRINSKRKGANAERELAKVLCSYGYDARRGRQFCGSPESPDVSGLSGIHIECKHVERLNIYDAIAQATRDAGLSAYPTVMHKKNNKEWLVTMRLEDWIEIYERAGI